MLSNEEVEDVLPCPIKIEICCDPDDFRMAVQDSFIKLLERHNDDYETKIEQIARHYLDIDRDELEYNEFNIYVGKELIHKGKGPELFDTTPILDENFYLSIVSITEGILNAWHDKIIEIQEENKIKLNQYEEDEYHELLYAYYNMRIDSRAFLHLKKLAQRYPNSKYMNKLRRVYRSGSHGWHNRNLNLSRKMSKREEGYDF